MVTIKAHPEPLFTGSCFCKAINFTLNQLPTTSRLCHCTDCRKWTSTSYSHDTVFPKSALNITVSEQHASGPGWTGSKASSDPAPKPITESDRPVKLQDSQVKGSGLTVFGSDKEGTLQFCSICGTTLFITVSGSHAAVEYVVVPAGTIDGSEVDERLKPTKEFWCMRKEKWLPAVVGEEQCFDKN